MTGTEIIAPLAASTAEGVIPSCLKVAAASVAGQQHIFEGRGCEDAWATSHAALADGSSVVTVCVCDGAGSAAFGAEGANLTSRLVTEFLANHFESILEEKTSVGQIIETVQDAIRAEATLRESSIREFACTIVAIACSTEGRWLAVHLGDGGIVMQTGERLSAVSLPMKGQYSNVTYFVTDKDADECIRYVRGNPGDPKPDAFVLFSDGVENLLINRKTGEAAQAISRMAGWLTKFSEVEVTAGLTAELINFFRTQTGDDCSIAILNRVPKLRSEIQAPTVVEVNDGPKSLDTNRTSNENKNDAEGSELGDSVQSEDLPAIASTLAVAGSSGRNKRLRILLLGLAIIAVTAIAVLWPFLSSLAMMRKLR